MDKFIEKTINTKKIFAGKVISVQVDDVLLPDGNTSKRELVKHPGAVAIIPITRDGKIVLVEQYRKPLERSIVEIPAGKMEYGELPEITAVRELEEETGYTTEELHFVTSFYTSPGFADEIIHIYYTDTLQLGNGELTGDDDEFVQVIELTLSEAEQYIKEKRIYDAKTMYALMYVKMMRMI